MFGNRSKKRKQRAENKTKKFWGKLEKKQAKFVKKSLKYKPTNVKVGDTFVNPTSGVRYEVIGQQIQTDKKTGIKSRKLKIKTNFEPRPNFEIPDSLFITDDLVKVEKTRRGKQKAK